MKVKNLQKKIQIEVVGKIKEFKGCEIKIDKSEPSTKFTKPVMIQTFFGKFSAGKKRQVTPAEPNTVLKRPESGDILVNNDQSKCWLGMRKMMHMMRWSVPDIYNATCNCTRHTMLAERTHYDAMVKKWNTA